MPEPSKRIIAAALLAAALLLVPAGAGAYSTLYSNGQQVKWPDNSATFMVNTSGMPGGALDAVKSAFSTWSGAGANFTMNYGGSSTSTAHGKNDGTNLIDYGRLDDNDLIALCLYWYEVRSGKLLDADIRLNSKLPWSANGDGGSYDVQNIITHELGHTLVLLDLYGKGDGERTMYGLADQGETKKRTLDPDDVAGVKSLYP